MIYQMTSVSSIIVKISREFPSFTSEMINDIVEMCGEATECIGYCGQTVKKDNVSVTIANHRGKIPCDLYLLNGEPSYNGFPLTYGTGNFRYSKDATDATNGSFGESDVFSVTDLNVDHSHTKQQILDKFLTAVTINGNTNSNNTDHYIITPGYFRTTFESGTIYIDYEAFQRDDDGFPMIPDYYEFKEAVSWYIKMKLMERGVAHPVLKYGDAVQQWEKFESKAYKKAELPDRARMNSFINQWVRLIPDIRPSSQFYENLGNSENIVYK